MLLSTPESNFTRYELVKNGADRDRTGDPLLAKQVLSQLSYRPESSITPLTITRSCPLPPTPGRSAHITSPHAEQPILP